MYDRPPIVALRESLSEFVADNPKLVDGARLSELREQVCAVVDDLKGAGWLPERVIVAVKQVAHDAGLSPSRGVLSVAPLTESDAVIVEMVGWCIQRYYHETRPTS